MGCQNIRCRKPPGYLPKYIGVVFLCVDYFLLLQKSVNSGILKMKKDNRLQGGLAYRYGRNSTRLLVKVWGWIFFLRNNYGHNIRMKVSNAMINIPKAIRSWKSNCFIGITSSLYEGHTTLQHGCHKNYIIKFSFVQ